jgi:hypothetical protein
MSEPVTETDVEVEEIKPAKKVAKAKPLADLTQTEKARANALAKMKAAGR